jgi:hypothetical protein
MPAFAPCKLYRRDQATGESNEVQLFTNNTESLEWLPLRSGEQFHHAGFLSLWRKVMSWSACMKPSNIGCDLSAAMGWVLKLHICNCSSFICVAPFKRMSCSLANVWFLKQFWPSSWQTWPQRLLRTQRQKLLPVVIDSNYVAIESFALHIPDRLRVWLIWTFF